MFDVITVGGAVVDFFIKTHPEIITIDNRRVLHREELIAYPVGSKILIDSVNKNFGGGAFNAAVSFSHLGLKTGFLGCLGRDSNGVSILHRMGEEKIEFLGHFSDVENGFSIILDSYDEERTILTFRGSNDLFDFNKVDKSKLKTRWFYISSFTKAGFKSFKKLVDFAVRNEVKLAFNPSTYLAKMGFERLRKIITNLDILVLNRVEAEFISNEKFVKNMLLWLKDYVRRVVVVTDGKNGAFAFDGELFYRVRVPKVRVRETTGAGDAFSSTFVYGMMKRDDVVFSLKAAMLNSMSVVSHLGAQNILLSESELLRSLTRKRIVVRSSKSFID